MRGQAESIQGIELPPSYSSAGKLLRIPGTEPLRRIEVAELLLNSSKYHPNPACLVAEHCADVLVSCAVGERNEKSAPYSERYWILLARALDKPCTLYFEVPQGLILAMDRAVEDAMRETADESTIKSAKACGEVLVKIVKRIRGADPINLGKLFESAIRLFIHGGKCGEVNILRSDCMDELLELYGTAIERCMKGKRILEIMTRHVFTGLGKLISGKDVPERLKKKAIRVIERGILSEGISEVSKKLLDHTSYFTVLYSWISADAETDVLQIIVMVVMELVITSVRDPCGSIGAPHTADTSVPNHGSKGAHKGPRKLPVEIQLPISLFKGLCASLRKRLGKVETARDQRLVFKAFKVLFETANRLSIYHPSYEGALQKSTVSGLSISGEVVAAFIRFLCCMEKIDRLRRIIEPAVDAGKEVIRFSFDALERQGTRVIPRVVRLIRKATNRFELEHVISLLLSILRGYKTTRQLPAFIALLSIHLGHLGHTLQFFTFQDGIVEAVKVAPRGQVAESLKSLTGSVQNIIDNDDSEDERVSEIWGRAKMFEDAAVLAAILVESANTEQLLDTYVPLRDLASLIRPLTEPSCQTALFWIKSAVCHSAFRAGWNHTRSLVDSIVTSEDWKVQIETVPEVPTVSNTMEEKSLVSFVLARARFCVGITQVAALEAQKAMIEELAEAESCRAAVVRACKASLATLLRQDCAEVMSQASPRYNEKRMIAVDEPAGNVLIRSLATVVPLLQSFATPAELEAESVKMLITNFLISSLIISPIVSDYSIFNNSQYCEVDILRKRIWTVLVCLGSRMLIKTGCGSSNFKHSCDDCQYASSFIQRTGQTDRWKVIENIIKISTRLLPYSSVLNFNAENWNSFVLEVIASSHTAVKKGIDAHMIEKSAFEYFAVQGNTLSTLTETQSLRLMQLLVLCGHESGHSVVRKCVRSLVGEDAAIGVETFKENSLAGLFTLVVRMTHNEYQQLMMTTQVLGAVADILSKSQSIHVSHVPWTSLVHRHIDLTTKLSNDEYAFPRWGVLASACLVDLMRSIEENETGLQDQVREEVIGIIREHGRPLIEKATNFSLYVVSSLTSSPEDFESAVKYLSSFASYALKWSPDLFSMSVSSSVARLIAASLHSLSHENEYCRLYSARLLNHILGLGDCDTGKCITTTLLAEIEDAQRGILNDVSGMVAIRGLRILLCGLPEKQQESDFPGSTVPSGRVVSAAKYAGPKAAVAAVAFVCQLWATGGKQENNDKNREEVVLDALDIAILCASKPGAYPFEGFQVNLLLQCILALVYTPAWRESQSCGYGTVELCTRIVRHYGNDNSAGSLGILQAVSFVVQRILSCGDSIGLRVAGEITRLFGHFAERGACKSTGRRFLVRALLEDTVIAVTKISIAGIRRALAPGIWALMDACNQLELMEILVSLRPNSKNTFKSLREEYLEEKYRGSV